MDDKEIGKALLKHGAPPASDPAAIQSVLRRDRRRVKVLTCLSVASGVIACGLMIWMMYVFLYFVLPRTEFLLVETIAQPAHVGATQEQRIRDIAYHVGALTQAITWAVVGFGFSLVFTILLIVTSRRATLRQIDGHLSELTTELRALRHATRD